MRYMRLYKCGKCGFTEDRVIEVFGDYDGPDVVDLKNCPVCAAVEKHERAEAAAQQRCGQLEARVAACETLLQAIADSATYSGHMRAWVIPDHAWYQIPFMSMSPKEACKKLLGEGTAPVRKLRKVMIDMNHNIQGYRCECGHTMDRYQNPCPSCGDLVELEKRDV
jgi:hypothetical protein